MPPILVHCCNSLHWSRSLKHMALTKADGDTCTYTCIQVYTYVSQLSGYRFHIRAASKPVSEARYVYVTSVLSFRVTHGIVRTYACSSPVTYTALVAIHSSKRKGEKTAP